MYVAVTKSLTLLWIRQEYVLYVTERLPELVSDGMITSQMYCFRITQEPWWYVPLLWLWLHNTMLSSMR